MARYFTCPHLHPHSQFPLRDPIKQCATFTSVQPTRVYVHIIPVIGRYIPLGATRSFQGDRTPPLPPPPPAPPWESSSLCARRPSSGRRGKGPSSRLSQSRRSLSRTQQWSNIQAKTGEALNESKHTQTQWYIRHRKLLHSTGGHTS